MLALAVGLCTNLTHAEVYQTTSGTGPDKWASVWLIENHVKGASVHVTGEDEKLAPWNTHFDVPGATFNRTADHTTYATLVRDLDLNDSAVMQLAAIIQDMEINTWQPDELPETTVVESAYRTMQKKYGRDQVARSCYNAFFNGVARILNKNVDLLNYAASDLMPRTVQRRLRKKATRK